MLVTNKMTRHLAKIEQLIFKLFRGWENLTIIEDSILPPPLGTWWNVWTCVVVVPVVQTLPLSHLIKWTWLDVRYLWMVITSGEWGGGGELYCILVVPVKLLSPFDTKLTKVKCSNYRCLKIANFFQLFKTLQVVSFVQTVIGTSNLPWALQNHPIRENYGRNNEMFKG